jgi:protease-4
MVSKKRVKKIKGRDEEYFREMALEMEKKRIANKGKFKTIFYVLLFLWLFGMFVGKSFSADVGDKVAIIPIEGAIMSLNGQMPFSSEVVDSETIVEFIEKANETKNVKAILLKINSPGGTVVASKEIVKAVDAVEKPVVALIREIGTSGAYWVASSADFIVADELSLTGSIGVNGGYLEFGGLMKEYGVGYEEMKAGKYKDIGNSYEKLSSEEREILQDKVDRIHEEFILAIAENRGLDFETVKQMSEGLYYLGLEAMDLGLIDGFGGFKEAKAKTEELSGVSDLGEIEYVVEEGLFDVFGKISGEGSYNIGRGVGDSLVGSRNFLVPKL